jgi:hypothetical protein
LFYKLTSSRLNAAAIFMPNAFGERSPLPGENVCIQEDMCMENVFFGPKCRGGRKNLYNREKPASKKTSIGWVGFSS